MNRAFASSLFVTVIRSESFLLGVGQYTQKLETEPPLVTTCAAQEIAKKVSALVGSPARQGAYASRQQIGVPFERIHVDIGGCGRYLYQGTGPLCGFNDAVNINDTRTNPDSKPTEQPIPALVLVESWNSRVPPPYPLAPNFADYVTMQSAPLKPDYVKEVARILKPRGIVGLWIDQPAWGKQIRDLAALLNCSPKLCTGDNLNMDEFKGKYVFPKLLLQANR